MYTLCTKKVCKLPFVFANFSATSAYLCDSAVDVCPVILNAESQRYAEFAEKTEPLTNRLLVQSVMYKLLDFR
jgi:hypothetical protein